MTDAVRNAKRLTAQLRGYRRVAVAFSGGVDSSVVAAAAKRAGLDWLIAVTADSPSVPGWQLEMARQIAAQIGISHHRLPTTETSLQDYRKNDSNRCFFCKETLYTSLQRFCEAQRVEISGQESGCGDSVPVVMVSGTNADDLGDHRPGIEAGRMNLVQTPLADLRLGKSEVRELAKHFGLSNHDLPASPCLASRIAYGVEVTPVRLGRIERAEAWIREQGFRDCRVRLHADDLARVEVPASEMSRLFELSSSMANHFRTLGFQYVTLDLEGFQSGKMNRVVVPLGVPAREGRRETV